MDCLLGRRFAALHRRRRWRCKLWSRKDGAFVRRFVDADRITGAVFTADGCLLLTASADNSVEQWDLVAGQPLPGRTLKHPQGVSSLAVSADGRTAVTGCNDGKVRIWNVESATVEQEIQGDAPQVVSLSHDGRRIVSTDSASRLVRLIELETVRQFALRNNRSLAARRNCAALGLGRSRLPDLVRQVLVGRSAAVDRRRRRRTTAGRRRRRDGAPSLPSASAVASVDFSPNDDGKYIVTGSFDQTVKIWSSATGKATHASPPTI